jgi:hypothetical protein
MSFVAMIRGLLMLSVHPIMRRADSAFRDEPVAALGGRGLWTTLKSAEPVTEKIPVYLERRCTGLWAIAKRWIVGRLRLAAEIDNK